jgi:type I restriction enzyme S subunit
MELKQGYKQSNFGLIPEDWQILQLGEVAIIKDGTHQTPKYYDSGVPFFSVENVTGNEFKKTKFISEKEHKYLTRFFKIQKGDVLMTRIGSIGDCKFIDWEPEASFYVSLALLKFKDFDTAKYFVHFSKSSFFQKEIDLNSLQHAVPKKINLGNISLVRILIPNKIEEQTAIANALSDMDALISQTEKLIEKKKAIKLGAMQELLKPKEGWVTKKLGDVCVVIGGSTPSTTNPIFWDGDINWFTPTEVGLEKYLFSSKRKITKVGLASCSARILPAGTILLTTRAGIGDLGILKFEAATNQGFQNLLATSEVDNEFIYYLMQTKKIELIKNASGSTFLEISPSKLKAIEVSMPTLNEQKEIASILQEFDENIQVNEAKLKKLKQQKQGMMQALLTGKIRLVS